MYNYKLAKIDPMSALKQGTFLAVAVSVIMFTLNILELIFKVIKALFTHGQPIIVLQQGVIQLFFSILVLLLFSIAFGASITLLSIIYNYSTKWFDGIKVHVEEYVDTKVEENAENSKAE